MTGGWSRQREDSKLSAWAKSQDLALVERELERAKKDLCRAGSVSLKPEYILKRQQQRARAKDATNRLSTMGLCFDLGPFLFDYPVPQPTSSKSKGTIKQASNEQCETLHLKEELKRLKDRESELEYALATSETKRLEDRKVFDRDRKLMMSVIAKLKLEIKYSWSCIARLREKYEGASFGIESGRTSLSKIYQTDESYERTFRPSSIRTTPEKADHRTSSRPSSLASMVRSTHSDHNNISPSRTQSLKKSSLNTSLPTSTSLRNTPETSRTRRTSLS